MAHVFISYVHENQKEVDRLCEELTKHGGNVWLDRNNINPGQFWKDAIHQAIQEGAFFIACFSEHYWRRSEIYMNEELLLAVRVLRGRIHRYDSWFIPVLLSECVVPTLQIDQLRTLIDIQFVPLYLAWDKGIRRILDVIKPTPSEVQRLIEALHSDDENVRMASAIALGRTSYNRAVPALVVALEDESSRIRASVAEALGNIGDAGAITALINALNDENELVATNSAYALVKIGEIAVNPLIEALNSQEYFKGTYAAWALGRIGTFKALEAVAEYERKIGEALRKG